MAFYNAAGEQVVELNINTPDVKKRNVVYLDPAKHMEIIELLRKHGNSIEKVMQSLLKEVAM